MFFLVLISHSNTIVKSYQIYKSEHAWNVWKHKHKESELFKTTKLFKSKGDWLLDLKMIH